jgi:nucleoside-diphosphate-sugar epimerase
VSRVLVTGATGLVGGNVCRLLAQDGVEVAALVRNLDDAQPLRDVGAELVRGDILDADSVRSAAAGCDGIVHAAAVLGGTAQDLDEQAAVNTRGSEVVFDVAAANRARVVLFSTIVLFDSSRTITEHSDLDPNPTDPYAVTKRAAYDTAMRRVGDGADIVVVVPGSVYGPSPVLSRALAPTSFNRVIRGALNGRLSAYPDIDSVWVYAPDVAEVATSALHRGKTGERFLAVGPEDAIDSRTFYNLACELAGVAHRVARVEVTHAEAVQTYGESMARGIARKRPVPAIDASWTRERLGVSPLPVREGLAETVAWLRDNDQIRD